MVTGRRTILAATGLSTLGVLPVFLFGGLSVFIREELPLDGGRLGVLVAVFFIASATSSVPGGRYADRRSARGAVSLAVSLSGLAMLFGGLLASALWHWGVVLWFAGTGNGIAQPTSSLLLARGVRQQRQGIAFGIKQAAIPASTLIAGAVVAVVAARLGWRPSFAMWIVLAAAILVALPPGIPAGRIRPAGLHLRDGDAATRPMLWLASATGLGAAYGTFLASFFIAFAVDSGVTPMSAGRILTVASVAGILMRLGLGLAADRMVRGHLTFVSRLALVGAAGFAGFAMFADLGFDPDQGPRIGLLLGAALIAYTAGWSWTPVFNYAIVQLNPNAPGAASAITQAGVFVGGVVGPVSLGWIVTTWSYSAAWWVSVALSLACAASIRVAVRSLTEGRDGYSPTRW